MALSELHPIILNGDLEHDLLQEHYPNSAGPRFRMNRPPQQNNVKRPAMNADSVDNKSRNKAFAELKSHLINRNPPRQNPRSSFSRPPLVYGFEPKITKASQTSSIKQLTNSRNRHFTEPKSSIEFQPSQNHNLQKAAQSSQGVYVGSEVKNRKMSTFKDHQIDFNNRDHPSRMAWDDGHQINDDPKVKTGNAFTRTQRLNTEKGQESIRRPTVAVKNSQISFDDDLMENNYEDTHLSFIDWQNNHDDGNFEILDRDINIGNHLPTLKVALKVNMRDGSPILKLNKSLQDEHIILLQNTEANIPLNEERKTYLLLKAPSHLTTKRPSSTPSLITTKRPSSAPSLITTKRYSSAPSLITTKRPSSAPFAATSFFRNVPQSSPRQETSRPPEFSRQIPAVPSNRPTSTIALSSVTNSYDINDRTSPTSRNYSNQANQKTHLKDEKQRLPYKNSDENLYYKEDLLAAVTEVYSRPKSTSAVTTQSSRSSSRYPISSLFSTYSGKQNNDDKSQLKKTTTKKSVVKTETKTIVKVKKDDDDGVLGNPGEDYPTYYEIPFTNFDCKEYNAPGFYADVQAGCQLFHNCDTKLQKHSFLCPNGTIFRQELFICDWWYNVRCEDSPEHYPLSDTLYAQP
ncbi:hypothetical protein CDAR_476261 [Caerostris darwini]|uniref:Chitin-binding type-2 domain-containing protein n=1 Tax=Caerostris darwini TaxID=1538125 RepID=A0AAV4P5D9_9ARAC|nr:hypothetical protein CDAR_476261 [Caerostris darwini]